MMAADNSIPASTASLADAYAYLQKTVGLIAVTLPFVVSIGHAVSSSEGMKGSISAYYYSYLGNYFVGSLFALGVFFLSYSYKPAPGYEWDFRLSNVASAMAVGVALFPTSSEGAEAVGASKVVAVIHLGFAGSLFVLLAIFSLKLFTKTNDVNTMTAQKRRRNQVYVVCGWIIVSAIVLIVIAELAQPPAAWHSLFWLESLAVVAFGVSWLIKGGFRGLLVDPEPAEIPL